MARESNGVPSAPAAGRWQGETLELGWQYAYRPEFIPLFHSYLGAAPGLQILEVGTGSSFLGRLLARSLESVTVAAVDADEKLLATARQQVEIDGLEDTVHLIGGNAYSLPFPDESFDLATSQTLL